MLGSATLHEATVIRNGTVHRNISMVLKDERERECNDPDQVGQASVLYYLSIATQVIAWEHIPFPLRSHSSHVRP